MTPLAKGRIVLWQGGSLWALRVTAPPGGPKSTDFHAHHAIQVTLALDGRYELHLPDRSIGGPALVVAPDLARWRDQLGDATGQVPVLAGSGSTWFVVGAFPDAGTVVRTLPATVPPAGSTAS